MVVKDPVDLIALILVIIGGLNWGLVGLFNIDLVACYFGAGKHPCQNRICGCRTFCALYDLLRCERHE